MSRRSLLIAGFVVLAAVVVATQSSWIRGHNSGEVDRGNASKLSGPIRIVLGEKAGRHDVGEVSRGSRREVPFVVSNRGPTAVTIGPIRVSCECLRVELDATRVEADTEVGGRAVIDMSHEPKFVGGLMLDAEAMEDGRQVFALKLSVEVK